VTDYPITAARAYEIGPVNRPVFESTDAREGAAAFAEKRTARWTG
jgi:hypothetical protein